MPHQCTNCGRGFPDGSKEMLSGCPDCGGNKFQFAPAGSALDRRSSAAGDRGSTGDHGSTGDRGSTTGRADVDSGRDSPGTHGSASSPDARRGQGESTLPDDHEFEAWPETARRPADRPETAGERTASTDQSSAAADGAGSRSAADRGGNPDERRDDAMADDFEWVEGDEDDAQASARSDVVSPDELPPRTDPTATDGPGSSDDATDDRRPDHGRVVSEPDADRPSLEELREELNDQFESIKIVQPGRYELNLMELYDREEHIVSLQEDGRYVINVPESWRESDDE